ncbi:MAG: phytoene desaturase [Beijerinckiaceae bacterium]|nr:phytoene desaturase [Beijerinckiaceae bacterium]
MNASRQPHAVVIGSGFGGLAAAIRLGARGYRVTVLERLDRPGGRAYVHKQDGFSFDAGPTLVTAPFLFEELWTLCGRKMEDDVKLVPLDPFYRIVFDDGSHFDCSGDPARMRAEVARLSPGDVEGYEAFYRASEARYSFGFEVLGNQPFSNFTDMMKALPKLAALRSDRSVWKAACQHVKDERLRILLSFHPLFIGGNPLSVTSVYILISYLEREFGVHFAMGGTGALVQGLAKLIEGHGNRIRTNVTVDEITVSNGRATGVRLENGELIPADIVVSNADIGWTYSQLLRNTKRKRWTDRKVDALDYSMGVFVWYFGTNRRYDDLAHHTVLMGPRYEGLLKDIFKNKVLSEDFSLYLHRPTATDPSLAPEGCDTFYALSPVPHLDADVDWTEMAEPYRQAIEARLEERLMPGLSQSIVSSRVTHPLEFAERLLSWRGAAFGPEPLLTQSAWFRTHNKSEDVDGLYFVGAGTHPGAGMPGVLASAKILDQVLV